jgi:hypothetical protein
LALPFSCTFSAVAITLVPLLLVEKLLYSLHSNFEKQLPFYKQLPVLD